MCRRSRCWIIKMFILNARLSVGRLVSIRQMLVTCCTDSRTVFVSTWWRSHRAQLPQILLKLNFFADINALCHQSRAPSVTWRGIGRKIWERKDTDNASVRFCRRNAGSSGARAHITYIMYTSKFKSLVDLSNLQNFCHLKSFDIGVLEDVIVILWISFFLRSYTVYTITRSKTEVLAIHCLLVGLEDNNRQIVYHSCVFIYACKNCSIGRMASEIPAPERLILIESAVTFWHIWQHVQSCV